MPQVFAGRTVIALERSAMTSRVVPRETTFSSLGDEAFFYYREDIMDYGKTLHLPQTEFPMRGNLPKREPQWLDFWQEHDIYKKRLAQREGAESFVLHDGPPYANGYLHIGHAMNKTLKDIIMKYKTMRGYYTPYRPGWDTHGLPIEHAVIKNTGLNRAEMSPLELRAKCLAYAKEFIEIQKKDFIRFGVMGDWDRPYLTFDPKLEDRELAVFGEMAKKGYIYKGRKTVYWCPVCETALAEAEIEYADKKSFSIFVKFPLIDARGFLPEGANEDNAFCVIWTTTPWTLPANMAIAMHPEIDYVWAKAGDEYYLMARDLVESALGACKIADYEVVSEPKKGQELEGMVFHHPFLERTSSVILGEHVTLDAGTGCVHTAPGHGVEDFEVGKKYGLDILSPVDDKGNLTAEAGEDLAGLNVLDGADVAVIKKLAHAGKLLGKSTLHHQFAHCWRSKNPVIYRATEQWFASVDDFRDDALKAVNDTEFIPSWGRERLYNMVADRQDWCISRQRVWGVPIPIFYCNDCHEAVITDETMATVRAKVREEGTDAWWKYEAKDLLPENFACPHCGGHEFTKESNIMDVWFDSGSTWSGVLEQEDSDLYPASMYLEGSDQHRGWFQSSLLTSVAVNGHAPYKTVLTHGFTMDGEGRKMSKSLGNTVAPQEIINQFGADVMRLWVSSADYQSDVRLSPKIVKQMSDVYRKIRNTFRFLLGNLSDFRPGVDDVAYEQLEEIDRWALLRLEEVREKVTQAYENYEFHVMYHVIHNYCTVDLSAMYLDIVKDRLYAETATSVTRRAAQTVLYQILQTLVRLIAPVLSFTAEEIWQAMPAVDAKAESVHLTDWPKAVAEHRDAELGQRWEKRLTLRTDILKALEAARQDKVIGHPLDAKVVLHAAGETYDELMRIVGDLAALAIVSEVEVVEGTAGAAGMQAETTPDLVCEIQKSTAPKCERCWIHSETVGDSAEHPTVCARCARVLAEESVQE